MTQARVSDGLWTPPPAVLTFKKTLLMLVGGVVPPGQTLPISSGSVLGGL